MHDELDDGGRSLSDAALVHAARRRIVRAVAALVDHPLDADAVAGMREALGTGAVRPGRRSGRSRSRRGWRGGRRRARTDGGSPTRSRSTDSSAAQSTSVKVRLPFMPLGMQAVASPYSAAVAANISGG
jgi:hypothetical protein